jgi:hypothetical protein
MKLIPVQFQTSEAPYFLASLLLAPLAPEKETMNKMVKLHAPLK